MQERRLSKDQKNGKTFTAGEEKSPRHINFFSVLTMHSYQVQNKMEETEPIRRSGSRVLSETKASEVKMAPAGSVFKDCKTSRVIKKDVEIVRVPREQVSQRRQRRHKDKKTPEGILAITI